MRYPRRWASIGFCLLASQPQAQTADPVFARWRWNPDVVGSRPAGIGGAFVPVADSNKAAYANPAGLTLIPLREAGLSSGLPWLGVAAGGRSFRLAAYGTQTRDERNDVQLPAAAQVGAGSFLESSVWEAGLAVGLKPLKRVRLGAALAFSRLRSDGESVRPAAGTLPARTTSLRVNDTRSRFTAGMLIDLVGAQRGSAVPSLKLGVAYQPGFDWSGQLTESGTTTTVAVRRPTLVGAGFAYRPNDRWSFSIEGDHISYSEVVHTLRRNLGAEAVPFRLENALEPHGGAEYAIPLTCGCGVLKLRSGLRYESPGRLQFTGADPALVAAFGTRHWRTVFSFGASLFAEYFHNAVRLDVDSKDVFDGPDLSFGIVWRF